jgi:hypothetical protein
MIDLKNYFLMPSVQAGLKLANGQVYGRETHHLEGMNLSNNTKVYAYHYDSGHSMWFTKTPKAFPWDVKAYDTNFIYDTATELDWKSSRNFKKNNPQWPMCPRFWNGDPTLYQFSQHANWQPFVNCIPGVGGDVGPVYYPIQGPFPMDFGGDVGIAGTILLTYYWSDMKQREQLFLTDRAGWVDWTHAVLTQLSPNLSQYVIDARVTHNKIVPGTLIPQFPCTPMP